MKAEIIVRCFPISAHNYFSKAMSKGPRWVFNLIDETGKWEYCVYGLATIMSKLFPESDHIVVTFAKLKHRIDPIIIRDLRKEWGFK